jgi:hypothetical protein
MIECDHGLGGEVAVCDLCDLLIPRWEVREYGPPGIDLLADFDGLSDGSMFLPLRVILQGVLKGRLVDQ